MHSYIAVPVPAPSHPVSPGTRQMEWGLAPYSHWMYHALQIALLRRILSRQRSRSPLKFFHFGDTSFPLKHQAKERLRGIITEPYQFGVSQRGCALRHARGHQPGGKSGAGAAVWLRCRLLAMHLWEHPREHPELLSTLKAGQT